MYSLEKINLNNFIFFNTLKVTILTTDRRQNKLSVKVNLIDMHPSLLVDFRLSKVNKFDIVELRKMYDENYLKILKILVLCGKW